MNRCKFFLSLLLAGTIVLSCKEQKNAEEAIAEPQKPNIIYILADDLGYAEVGAYGQEKIETPNIDALAKSGMLFTQHYSSAPVCAPARYMFLTGKHAGQSYIRGNHEWGDRGDVWNYYEMAKDSTLEGQHPVPEGTITLANHLQNAGYTTGLVGKWGLGAPHTKSIPNEMGFDFFFGYNCQRQAHTYNPLFLYKNRKRVHYANDTIPPGTKLPKGADPNKSESYAAFNQEYYSSDLMFEELTDFVGRSKEHPFFLYWASPIPHVALQAPQRWVDYYVEKFGEEEPYLGERGYFPHKNPRAAYAAMVSYLDENIGKLVKQLKDEGIYENTLIIFTSDNGPSYAGGADPDYFDSAKPFRSKYGRGKGFVYEGGIRVPMIASWPGKIKAGSTSDLASAHYDMLATFAEVAEFEKPVNTNGISILPTLLGEGGQESHGFMYWEFPAYEGQVALRMGDWKLVRQNLKSTKLSPTLELYDLKRDPTEMNNVAKMHPEILAQIDSIFKKERTQAEVERFRMPILAQGVLKDK